MTHNDLIIPQNLNNSFSSSLILFPNPFLLFIILLTHHVYYDGSGPGIFPCECCVINMNFQCPKISLRSYSLSHSFTYHLLPILYVLLIREGVMGFIQSFQSKVLSTILNAPWYVSNYMTHKDIIIPRNPHNSFPSSLILFPKPFPLIIIILTHHFDYAGSGPGIFSCECCVSNMNFQYPKISLRSYSLSHAFTYYLLSLIIEG